MRPAHATSAAGAVLPYTPAGAGRSGMRPPSRGSSDGAAIVAGDVSRERYTAGMRNAASGVSVVTTDGPGGRYGSTVSAMASVTADPPALLVCVHRRNLVAPAVVRNGVFCVNVLNEDQAEIAEVFAGRKLPPEADRFRHGRWLTLRTGAPALADALTAFDCELAKEHEFGSHAVFIGVVTDVQAGVGAPLIYYDRGYRRVVDPRRGPGRARSS